MKSNKGFTTIELVIVMIVSAALITTVMPFFINFYLNSQIKNAEAELNIDSVLALEIINADLRYSIQFSGADYSSTSSSDDLYDPNKPSGGWGTNDLIVLVSSLNSSGIPIINSATNKPYLDQVVYYIDGTDLRRRSIPNTSASGNSRKRSCPDAAATPTCKADSTLANSVSSFSVTYFDTNDDPATNISTAKRAEIVLGLERIISGETITSSIDLGIVIRE